MKATELKIGDLVLYKGKPAKIIDFMGDILRCEAGGLKYIEHYSASNVKPIPLTKEILEKNGWFLRRPQVYLLEHNSLTLKILVREDFSSVWLKNLDAQVWLADIKYVHQLQHILWALGIDDNLKI